MRSAGSKSPKTETHNKIPANFKCMYAKRVLGTCRGDGGRRNRLQAGRHAAFARRTESAVQARHAACYRKAGRDKT